MVGWRKEVNKTRWRRHLPFPLEFQRVNDFGPLLADVPQVKTVVGCGRDERSFIDQKLELDDGGAGGGKSGRWVMTYAGRLYKSNIKESKKGKEDFLLKSIQM